MDYFSGLILAALLGLIIGSFLNVLIHRGPAIWGLLGPDEKRGSLWGPRSQCPSCNKSIKSWHNIPLFSFLLLKGQCAYCGAKISTRYPLVELTMALAAIIAVATLGFTHQALAAAILFAFLISLAVIDFETGYLPDALTFPLIGLGLVFSLTLETISITNSIIGAVLGYGIFWLTAFAYRTLRGREGLGLGDAKLLGALGAWSGWESLAPTILIASLGALILIGLIMLTGRKFDAGTAIRFGPALAFSGAIIHLLIASDQLLILTGYN